METVHTESRNNSAKHVFQPIFIKFIPETEDWQYSFLIIKSWKKSEYLLNNNIVSKSLGSLCTIMIGMFILQEDAQEGHPRCELLATHLWVARTMLSVLLGINRSYNQFDWQNHMLCMCIVFVCFVFSQNSRNYLQRKWLRSLDSTKAG